MKAKRQAKILELIRTQVIDTQEELLRRLREEDFAVTQATVSRDIRELRLIKTLASDGKYRYSTVQMEHETLSTKFHSLFAETVTGVDHAQNIVVVRCLSGMAQAACAAMDSLHWDNVVGTLGGEDTFICILKTEDQAVELVAELKKMMKRR